MTNDTLVRHITARTEPDGRRRQLRALLVSAADAARASRQFRAIADCTRPARRAVRERVTMLLNAAN